MIELHDIGKRFGATQVVQGVTLNVAKGELLALLGGSGSGKTTTLKMINRLIEPSHGTVRVDGRDVTKVPAHGLRRAVGYCFQQVGLFPHMTVAQNIGITPTLLGWSKTDIAARVDELLELVELEPATFRDRMPEALSGGQKQRIGVARSLAARPQVVLFDEPFGALDPLTRDRLQQSLASIRRAVGMTAVFVTHDITEAYLLADRIGVMRQGRLVQVGTPQELVERPKDPYVAELLQTPSRQLERVGSLLEHTRADAAV